MSLSIYFIPLNTYFTISQQDHWPNQVVTKTLKNNNSTEKKNQTIASEVAMYNMKAFFGLYCITSYRLGLPGLHQGQEIGLAAFVIPTRRPWRGGRETVPQSNRSIGDGFYAFMSCVAFLFYFYSNLEYQRDCQIFNRQKFWKCGNLYLN